MHNVEKSAFQKGQYVGYGGGAVWHIRNYGKGNWKATPQGNNKHSVFSCATLRDVSTQLETLSAKPMDAALTSARKANPAPRKRAASLYGAKMKHLESALSALNMLIDKGAEFPDAVIKVSESTGVDVELLTAEYDKYWRAWSELSKAHRKTNPATRKRAISRPSQVTKKAPSKRLVARRKVAAKKPVKGYFPNPIDTDKEKEILSALETEMKRLKGYFPYRIIWGGYDPKNGDFESGAVSSMRIPNSQLRKGWKVFKL